MKFKTYLTTFVKLSSICVDLDLKHETLALLEEMLSESLRAQQEFLSETSKSTTYKIKFEILCTKIKSCRIYCEAN